MIVKLTGIRAGTLLGSWITVVAVSAFGLSGLCLLVFGKHAELHTTHLGEIGTYIPF